MPYNWISGYTTTRGDNGKVTITSSTNTGITTFGGSGYGWIIQNFDINCASLGSSYGISNGGYFNIMRNLKISNCTARAILTAGTGGSIEDNEITGCTAACDWAIYANSPVTIIRNYIHDNVSAGIRVLSPGTFVAWNLITNNTGAISDGIATTGSQTNITIFQNTIYKSGRHGINVANALMREYNIRNNLLVQNVGYGIVGDASAGSAALPMYDGNFYYSNTSGARSNMDDTGSVNAINASSPYVNVLDVTLSVDPFTNAAGNDYSLNTTAGGGAAVTGAGTPGAMPGTSVVGAISGGVFQPTGSGLKANPLGGFVK